MKQVLVVDDDESIRLLLINSLKKLGYDIEEARSGAKAIKLAASKKYDLILMDISMPNMDGFDTLNEIRTRGASRGTNVMMVTADSKFQTVEKAIKWGACDYVVKPFDKGLFLHKVGRWINKGVEEQWKKLEPDQEQVLHLTMTTLDKAFNAVAAGRPLPYKDFRNTCEKMLEVMDKGDIQSVLGAVKDHDSYTFVHSLRVGIYLSMFAQDFGSFTKEDILTVTSGGVIHDVGKAKTPIGVLNKPGKFTEYEWVEMKEHVNHTVEILKRTPGIPEPIIEIGWNHHEKLDGSGYPRGLKGTEIGTLARMAAIVDIYVALTDKRVYKPAFPPEKALEMMDNPKFLDRGLLREFGDIIRGMGEKADLE
ncbi:MAG: response regulator [Candidatus Desulfatibia sp.]|uniref:response regulator n=1 Tax=Candidatus Desulfatibia sp. TaxID=3101189 RepID=UPI002F30713D